MKEKDLLQYCRYYKGGETQPNFKDPNKGMLWFYEKTWVNETLGGCTYSNEFSEYSMVGLSDFRLNDNVPLSLKAFLFNRYARGCYSIYDAVDIFKDFMNQYYPVG